MLTDDEISLLVNKKFREGVRKWMQAEGEKREKNYLHVSSFEYKCVRKVWYELKYADRVPDVEDTALLRMWIGTKLHETPITDNHEFRVEADIHGMHIGGRIDEIFEIDGHKYIIDKKFVKIIPSQPNDHYMTQVMYYAVLYYLMTGEFVDGVGIHYFVPVMTYDASVVTEKTYVRQLTQEDILSFKEFVEDQVLQLKTSLEKDTLPPPTRTWYCQYCPFSASCVNDSVDYVEGDKK